MGRGRPDPTASPCWKPGARAGVLLLRAAKWARRIQPPAAKNHWALAGRPSEPASPTLQPSHEPEPRVVSWACGDPTLRWPAGQLPGDSAEQHGCPIEVRVLREV